MTTNAALTRKVQRLISSRNISAGTAPALDDLQSVVEKNTLDERRALRSTLEKRRLQPAIVYQEKLNGIAEAVENLLEEMNKIDRECCKIEDIVKKTHGSVDEFLETHTKLSTGHQNLSKQHALASSFVRHFQLSPSEVRLLQGASGSSVITNDFYVALEHVVRVSRACRSLLSLPHPPPAMIDVLDAATVLMDTAFERISRWSTSTDAMGSIQTESSSQSVHTLSDISRALRALKRGRPSLYEAAIAEIARSRSIRFSSTFEHAILVGGYSSSSLSSSQSGNQNNSTSAPAPRPLSLSAHSPCRYIGDLLAWIHVHTLEEIEIVNDIIGSAEGDDLFPLDEFGDIVCEETPETTKTTSSSSSSSQKGSSGFNTVVDSIIASVIPGLSMRVKGALGAGNPGFGARQGSNFSSSDSSSSKGDMVQNISMGEIARISSLLGFYSWTFENLLGGECSLSKSLNSMHHGAASTFSHSLEKYAQKLVEEMQMIPRDLSPPSTVLNTMRIAVDIIESFASSLTDNNVARVLPSVQSVVSTLVSAVVKSCTLAAASRRLGRVESAIFLANVVCVLIGGLSGDSFLEKKQYMLNSSSPTEDKTQQEKQQAVMEYLQGQRDAHTNTIIEETGKELVKRVGLWDLTAQIKRNARNDLLSTSQNGDLNEEKEKKAIHNVNGDSSESLRSESSSRPLSKIPSLDAEKIGRTIMNFYALVPELSTSALMPRTRFVLDRNVRSEVRRGALRHVVDAYAQIYWAIHHPSAGYKDPSSILMHPPLQMQEMLLS